MNVHKSFYAKEYNLKNLEQTEYKQNVQAYLQNIATDDRRLLWITEYALDEISTSIKNYENEIVNESYFLPSANRQERINRLQEYIIRLKQDFIFVYSMYELLRNNYIENSANQFADFFKSTKTGKTKKQ